MNSPPLKKAMYLWLISSVILLSLPISASGHSQGLHWGVEVGARFDYRVILDRVTSSQSAHLNESIFVVVDKLPPIPDPYRYAYPDLVPLTPKLTHYYQNGSLAKNLPGYVSIYLAGNWTVYEEELSQLSCSKREVLETASTWGYHIVIELEDRMQESVTVFDKTSGVLLINEMDYYNASEFNYYHREIVLTTELQSHSSGFSLSTIIGIGIPFASAILVLGVMLKNRPSVDS